MARFEGEIAKIITGKFLNGDEISITLEEDEKLKLFFARKLYENEVKYVNSALMDEAKAGFAFRDKERVALPQIPDEG